MPLRSARRSAQIRVRCRDWRAPLRTPRAPISPTSGSPRCTSPRRGSAGCSPGGPEAPPSSTPLWTTARAPAWPPRCGPGTTGWRSTWSATSIRSSSSAAQQCSPPCRSSSRAWRTRPAPRPRLRRRGRPRPALNKALATAGASAQGLAGSLAGAGSGAAAAGRRRSPQGPPARLGRPGRAGRRADRQRPLREPDRRRRRREEGLGGARLAPRPSYARWEPRDRRSPLPVEGDRWRGDSPSRSPRASTSPTRSSTASSSISHAARGHLTGALERDNLAGTGGYQAWIGSRNACRR